MINSITKYVHSLGDIDEHSALTIAHDTLMDPNAKGSEFKNAKFRFLNHKNREVKLQRERFVTLDAQISEDDERTLLESLPYDDFNEREAALQDSQRQLIIELVDGMDERTTLIVQTFLEKDKPTVSSVAKQLELDRKQVYRCLNRMKDKFSPKIHGELSTVLIA